MSDYIELDGMTIDAETGDILDAADINDPLAFVVRKRHEAHRQEKEWENYRKLLDVVILKQQRDKKLTFGDVVSTIAGGSYSTTDAGAFAELLADMPLEAETVIGIIGSATGFKAELLRELRPMGTEIESVFNKCTTVHEKRTWVLTSEVRQPAPKIRRVEPEAVEA